MAEPTNRTCLGIDYGSRRIGVAKSDPMGMIASPLMTLEVSSNRDAIDKLFAIITEYQPDAIVIGYPISMSGEKSRKCQEVDSFIERLQTVFKGPIHKVDERLTSAEAARVVHAHGKKTGQDKKRIDRIAAVIILQQFLDSAARRAES
ncbi:MAG TPA: Holliday junction resolvase RuvX [Candidatus Deferrimicrobium sp.]|nr:Holliday junction resolvase RuvX [Candidatus Deferrimicrobium sp.]